MANETTSLNTRGAIATAVAKFIQDEGSNRRTMILVDLDRGYRNALRRFNWPQALRWLDTQISLAASAAYFFTPKDVRTLLRVVDATTPSILQELGLDTMIDHSTGFVDLSGLPCQYAHAGDSAINTVIAPATALEVLSDGTDVRTGFIEGILAGQTKRTSITLTGVTPVALGSWDEVTGFFFTTVSSSRIITLRTVSGATTVATVSLNETRSVYQRFRLAQIPQMTTALKIIYKYTPPMILSEDHEYIIPINDYLMEYAIAQSLKSRRQFSPAQMHEVAAENTLLMIWQESRGHRTEQYVPASPYTQFSSQFFTPNLYSNY